MLLQLLSKGVQALLAAIVCYLAHRFYSSSRKRSVQLLAFFHPHCDSGGGGERVLWMMIHALLRDPAFDKKLRIVIYASKGDVHKERILAGVRDSFRIDVTNYADRISFLCIRTVTMLDAKWYPIATMLFQSLASVVVGLECVIRLTPDIYCDTMGAAFTYPLTKILSGCIVATYTHYPIISSDMLHRVREQRPAYNNDGIISRSTSISAMKLKYYELFACAYTFVGSFADKVMVNSSWTELHIAQLWNLHVDVERKDGEPHQGSCNNRIRIDKRSVDPKGKSSRKTVVKLYPPCNTTHLQSIPFGDSASRKRVVLSIGQFRPEKDHNLQLR